MNCQICQRDIPIECMEKHHLVPKSRKKKVPRSKRKATKITIDVCINCGDQIHKLFSNKELQKNYNTLEALLDDDRVKKWVGWIGKKKGYSVPQKALRRR